MPKISAQDVARYAARAGFSGWELTEAVAISFAEDGSHDTHAEHHNSDGSTDYGLWQINSVHRIPKSDLFDPQKNANAAYAISSHGNDFTPWTTYTSGASGGQTNAAQAAIDSANISGQGSSGGVTGAIGSAGNAIEGAGGSVVDAVTAPAKWAEGFAAVLDNLRQRGFWLRVAEILGGLALGLGGLFLLGRIVAAEQVGGLVGSALKAR